MFWRLTSSSSSPKCCCQLGDPKGWSKGYTEKCESPVETHEKSDNVENRALDMPELRDSEVLCGLERVQACLIQRGWDELHVALRVSREEGGGVRRNLGRDGQDLVSVVYGHLSNSR